MGDKRNLSMTWWLLEDGRITLELDDPEVELDGIVTDDGIAWAWLWSETGDVLVEVERIEA